jgi:hypothetical protein
MFTIYTTESSPTPQPYGMPSKNIKDCREREFAIDSIRLLGLGVVYLFVSPVQLMVFYALIFWPAYLGLTG